jgi:hypothetical protein
MPTGIRPIPDQESSHVRSAHSARSRGGAGSQANPSAATSSRPRASVIPVPVNHRRAAYRKARAFARAWPSGPVYEPTAA